MAAPTPSPPPPHHCARARTRTAESMPTPLHNPFSTPSRLLNGRTSPAPGKFFEYKRAASTPPEITDENRVGSVTRGAQGDLPSASTLEQSWRRQQLSKKRSQYYGEVFACREPNNTVKERVARDSMIIAEVKLNCYLQSEHSFLADLSFQLSEIYQRPEACIMVTVAPEIPILLGGSTEPAYHMTITALQTEVAPTKNKRSTALVQAFMYDCLRIKARRGAIRFDPVAEENLATNGMTTLQEIEEMERYSSDDNGVLRTISRTQSRKGKKSSVPIFTERGKTPTPNSTSASWFHMKSSSGGTGDSKSTATSGPEPKRMKHRKSIMTIFGKRLV